MSALPRPAASYETASDWDWKLTLARRDTTVDDVLYELEEHKDELRVAMLNGDAETIGAIFLRAREAFVKQLAERKEL